MARPTTKAELVTASEDGFCKLWQTVEGMTDKHLDTPFHFAPPDKYKEAHWARDNNLRDVLVHLYEWHQLLLHWVADNMAGRTVPFLPAPYNWTSYATMNVGFFEKHQQTALDDAVTMLKDSHRQVMTLIGDFTDEQLFKKGAYPWTGTTTLGSYCVSATASHYQWALKKLKLHIKNCQQNG